MNNPLARYALLLSVIMLLGAIGLRHATEGPRPRMASAAQQFLDALPADLRARANLAFDDANRFDWHFVPREGAGVRFEEFDDEARRAAHRLLRTALSEQGYLKAVSIMDLETVLRALESRSGRTATSRDPGLYRVTVFGDPVGPDPWGFRVEGHHLSINISSLDEFTSATTPFFFGANPAEVLSGVRAGLRVLGSEEDLARELMLGLPVHSQRQAMIMTSAPPDILIGPDREDPATARRGLHYADMDHVSSQRARELLELVTANIGPDLLLSHAMHDRSRQAESMSFGWAGSVEPGRPHYWRLHGDTFIIEYDNTQNGANHVHLAWRDLTDDFGRDWLRDHHQAHDHSVPHEH